MITLMILILSSLYQQVRCPNYCLQYYHCSSLSSFIIVIVMLIPILISVSFFSVPTVHHSSFSSNDPQEVSTFCFLLYFFFFLTSGFRITSSAVSCAGFFDVIRNSLLIILILAEWQWFSSGSNETAPHYILWVCSPLPSLPLLLPVDLFPLWKPSQLRPHHRLCGPFDSRFFHLTIDFSHRIQRERRLNHRGKFRAHSSTWTRRKSPTPSPVFGSKDEKKREKTESEGEGDKARVGKKQRKRKR